MKVVLRSLDSRTFYGTFVSQIVLQQILALPALKLSSEEGHLSFQADVNIPFRLTPTLGH